MIHRLDWLPTGLSPSADFEAVVGVKKKVAGVGALDDDGISGGLRNVPASASAVAKKPTASVVAADADDVGAGRDRRDVPSETVMSHVIFFFRIDTVVGSHFNKKKRNANVDRYIEVFLECFSLRKNRSLSRSDQELRYQEWDFSFFFFTPAARDPVAPDKFTETVPMISTIHTT